MSGILVPVVSGNFHTKLNNFDITVLQVFIDYLAKADNESKKSLTRMKIHSQLKQAIILIIIFKKLQYFLKKIACGYQGAQIANFSPIYS